MPRRTLTHTATLLATCAAVALSLAGCATLSNATPASADAISEYADAAGIAPALVYTTDVEDYDLAPQSVGAGAGAGLSATWFNPTTAAMLTIRTDAGDMTAASCPKTPMWDTAEQPVICADEDGIWHRSVGDMHEYVVVRDGALIRVTGAEGAPPEDLLAAAKAVHVPSQGELELLFSDLPDAPGEPIERGDLPENGDGAPVDTTGPGG